MPYTITGAVLAFVALGVNFTGTGLLLLFNPGSRFLRWYAVFSMFLIAWLLLQGLALLGHFPPENQWLYGLAVCMMPVAFFTTSLVQCVQLRDRYAFAILATAFAVLVFIIGDPLTWRYQLIWHTVGWGGGALYYIVRGRGGRQPEGRSRKILDTTLNLLAPLGVVSAILLRKEFVIYGLPVMTIIIVFLVFFGVVNHRYYDIEVRAARSGDIGLQAAEHERLALLGELSASIAHEVRNPLTGMRSLAQRIRDEPLDEPRRQRYLGVILDEMGRLETIVSNLLGVARRPAVQAHGEKVELAPLFSDLELLVDSRAKRANVTLVSTPRALTASAPRDAVAQALLNLLLNAIAYAPPGTQIDLEAEAGRDAVTIVVRDRGPGIPESDRERVFEPFHTSSGGTGLGLAVVRSIARDHDWTIAIRDTSTSTNTNANTNANTKSTGTEMRLTIPNAAA